MLDLPFMILPVKALLFFNLGPIAVVGVVRGARGGRWEVGRLSGTVWMGCILMSVN